jgi:Uma2 family endonuclease
MIRNAKITVCHDAGVLSMPARFSDLKSFRGWAKSDESPDHNPVCYLAGEVWIDLSKEQIFSHNQAKLEFARVLGNIAKKKRLGSYCSDGMLLSNEAADLSGNPDGIFVANSSFRSGKVQLIEGADSGFVEMEGSPDMVLEVVSDSSEGKDTEILHELYCKAGIREYWLVDARGDRLEFDIFRRTSRGYSATPKTGGWMKSVVFGQAFRLTRRTDELGHPEFTLKAR